MASQELMGYLIVNVVEAVGVQRDATGAEKLLWDEDVTDGFVKVEIRGGSSSAPNVQRVMTQIKPLKSGKIIWNEKLSVPVYAGCEELRLIVCRKRKRDGQEGTSVIAACGLFVKDIIAAVPITKQFELFRPRGAGQGGMVQVAMNFKSPDDAPAPATTGASPQPRARIVQTATFARSAEFTPLEPKKGGFLKKLVLLGLVAGGAAFAVTKVKGQKKKN